EDLYAVEMAELEIINEFLPKQLTEEELEVALKQIIAEVGAEGPKDMGKVMGAATKSLAGKADGKLISQKVKALLG
ncbi:MAG: GatB/YqeY domain-containing protein, partial [Cyclobacteriaceae bacterium]|nr:GatB/YqeY domain-containing protein [Cyclobacteriaceae bacterium]